MNLVVGSEVFDGMIDQLRQGMVTDLKMLFAGAPRTASRPSLPINDAC